MEITVTCCSGEEDTVCEEWIHLAQGRV